MSGAAPAGLRQRSEPAGTRLVLSGALETATLGRLWRRASAAARAARGGVLILDLAAVAHCDTAGAVFLLALVAAHGGEVRFAGVAEETEKLLARVRALPAPPPPAPRRSAAWPDGRAALARAADAIAFLGETLVALLRLPRRRRMLRLADLLGLADQAGVRALPLIFLLGFLIGLILAFQSAIPMRQFGADIYVANLVAISLLRELGPLLAAVVLAGRTGSAFAAEIGTMKVNEEIDALATMGLDPVTMLVLPRLVAALLVMPALTLALDLAGLAGMASVMRLFGFPLAAVTAQVQSAAQVSDLLGGLFKAVCFGFAVAAIGCRAGFSTGVGPRAVGVAATRAVVGGIVATIVLDGVFALVFYRLGL